MKKWRYSLSRILLFFLLKALVACQKPPSPEIQRLEKDARHKLICQYAFDDFNDRIYDFWLQKLNTPSEEDFRIYLEAGLLEDPLFASVSTRDKEVIRESATAYYKFVTTTLTASVPTVKEKLALLTALELGDSSDEKERLQKQWQGEKARLTNKLKSTPLPCHQGSPERVDPMDLRENPLAPQHLLTTSLAPLIEGLRRVIATAYQSCESLLRDPIDSNTKDVEGITTLRRKHPDGIGRRRIYGDLEKILMTHPYYETAVDKNCFDSRSHPLIYDYGGKPHTTTDPNAFLDFFRNSGSGTEALGLDCSGFVFSAIARGGLKLNPDKELKAILVNGISAKMFKDPQQNGLTCFEPLRRNQKQVLQAGDIIATTGHVVMVDEVGEDPFGLARAKDPQDCNGTILSSDGFDFIIAHSSPWKSGIGINRSKASSYLESTKSYREGLEAYAVAFCQFYFSRKGTSAILHPHLKVVRHNGSTACTATKTIPLQYESCIDQCFDDANSNESVSI